MRQAIYYTDNIDDIPREAVNIPIGIVFNKTALLSSLALACRFPDYFGHNWDSAWDCLTDSDIDALLLDLTGVKNIDVAELQVFIDLIADAHELYGKPCLWIKGLEQSYYPDCLR